MEYYSMNKNSTRVYTFLDEDTIVKNYHNCKTVSDDWIRGRRIYRKLVRNFEYLGVEQWMTASSLEESGRLHYIKTRSQELGMSPREFLFSDYVHEVDHRFNSNLKELRLSYYRKFEEYLA
jgi:hypothetical protein